MRTGSITRTTAETDIAVSVNLDGTGVYDVSTGIGFLDHMVEQFSRHSLIDVTMRVKGDLHIDQHHTTEDSAIALARRSRRRWATRRASPATARRTRRWTRRSLASRSTFPGVRSGVESRVHAAAPGRDGHRTVRALVSAEPVGGITLHIACLYGTNNHHIIEGIYKGFARAMRQAIAIDPRNDVPSTKGQLGG
jgi:imidazoleglycerol-phosphate dehydratase